MQLMTANPSIQKREKVTLRAWRRQGLLPSELSYDSLRQLQTWNQGRHSGQTTGIHTLLDSSKFDTLDSFFTVHVLGIKKRLAF